MEPITVILADDHPLLMEGVESLLAKHGIRVLGKITDPWQVVPCYKQHRPAVIVLDCRFGDELLGFAVARELLAADPEARIVFYSQFDEELVMKEAYQIGAFAFLSKETGITEFVQALQNAALAQTFYPPQITSRLLSLAIHGTPTPKELLSEREFNIFVLLAHGKSAAEVAEAIGTTTKTVSASVQSIKDKLKISRPAEYTLLAVKHRYIKP